MKGESSMGTILRASAALLIAAVPLLPSSARGEVIDSSALGFTVRNVVQISATLQSVYDNLVRDVGRWWNPAHTFSGDARNLSIDAAAGGCFCEELKNGGSVRHMIVVFANPGSVLRLEGAIGPMQPMGVTGSMTWSLVKSGDGTNLELTYSVGGYSPHGLQKIAVAADDMLSEQMGRLKNFVETGNASTEIGRAHV
jgi:hypothetical protein